MLWVAEKIKLNLKSAANFREAFLISVLGMLINDLFWAFVVYFLGSFSIAGMNSRLYLTAFAFATLCYGLFGFFFGGLKDVGKIYSGELDSFFIKPGNTLLHIATSRVYFEDLGDAILGIILLILLKPSSLSLLLFPFAFFICFSFVLFSYSLHFFIYEPTGKLHRSLHFLPLTFALWPSFALPYPISLIPYFFIPGAWLSFGLVEIAQGRRNPLFLVITSLFWTALSLFLWKKGRERYSSGTSLGITE